MAGDDQTTVNWESEIIPDLARLFLRVHRSYIREGRPVPGAFRDIGAGMSTDWDKYSTPEESRARARKPDENGIVEMNTATVRGISALVVEHTPSRQFNNRAHTDVVGEKTEEVRVKLRRLAVGCSASFANPPADAQ